MPNLHRGEIEAEIGGARRRLVLTLGALAELEAAFGADDLVALAERFGTGRLKARDLVCIIAAGLRGAGEAVSDDEARATAQQLSQSTLQTSFGDRVNRARGFVQDQDPGIGEHGARETNHLPLA